MAAIALATSLAPINSTMIMLALPELQSYFHIKVERVGWLVTFYLVGMASLQIVTGKIGDNIGRRIPIVGALMVFAAVSIGAALSPNFWSLLVCRTLQAISAATIVPNGFALIREVIPKSRRATRFGVLGATASLAATIGPPLGGIILHYFNWRYMFYFNVVIVGLALLFGWDTFGTAEDRRTKKQFDGFGAILFSGFLVLSTVWLMRLKSSISVDSVMLMGTMAILLVGFLRHMKHVDNPILQISFFKIPAFSIGSIAIALSNMSMYSVLMAIPIILAEKSGWTHLKVGFLLMALTTAMMIMSPIGGKLADSLGRKKPAILGLLGLTCGTFILLFGVQDIKLPMVILGLILMGVGIGTAVPGLQSLVVESISAEHAGAASGIISTSRYFGSIVGSIAVARLLSMESQWISTGFSVFLMVLLGAALSFFICLMFATFTPREESISHI